MMIRIITAMLLFQVMLLVGCQSSSELERVVVSGNVTYNGEPIEYGVIQFRPMDGTKGPSSSTEIVKGRYKMAAKGGVPVGRHQVVIQAFRGEFSDPNDPGTALSDVPAGPQFLPEKYNRQTELEFEALPSSSEVQQDFPLTSASHPDQLVVLCSRLNA
jgi:hypothetical protein